jgi:hypothetical protein
MVITAILLVTCVTSEREKEYYSEGMAESSRKLVA